VVATDQATLSGDPADAGDTPRTLTIEVGLPPRELCGNGKLPTSRGAHIGRNRTIAAWREEARLAVFQALADYPETLKAPYFPARVRVRVSAHVRRSPYWSKRRLDDDNFWRGMKAALDSLADAGAIWNDSQVTLDAVTWEQARPGEHGVTLELTEVTP
jgi:Holliday junction resolvase RusA-like endonuclease